MKETLHPSSGNFSDALGAELTLLTKQYLQGTLSWQEKRGKRWAKSHVAQLRKLMEPKIKEILMAHMTEMADQEGIELSEQEYKNQ